MLGVGSMKFALLDQAPVRPNSGLVARAEAANFGNQSSFQPASVDTNNRPT